MGQSKSGRTGSGISQKEQQKVLAEFRNGVFNVLVATCIGEEGLDICQVLLNELHDSNLLETHPSIGCCRPFLAPYDTYLQNKLGVQVEAVICYDTSQSPIRNIQRMGRTGRHEAGRVIHILTQGAEENKYKINQQVSTSKASSFVFVPPVGFSIFLRP